MRKAGREVDRLDYLRPEQGEEENVGERRLEARVTKAMQLRIGSLEKWV